MPVDSGRLDLGRTFTIVLLPCISFCAARILIAGLLFSETGQLYGKVCDKGSTLAAPAKLAYTGSDPFDNQICILVTFMREALDGGGGHFFHEFFAALGPSALVPFIEMRRAGYRISAVLPSMLVIGMFYQMFTGAVILPLWWTIFFLISGRNTLPLHPHYVEGTFFGYLLGYLVMSVALVTYRTVAVTLAWQMFPASIVLAQALYLCYQYFAHGDAPDCSHDVLQLMHITNFCWSAIAHAYTIFHILQSPAPLDSVKHVFHPLFPPISSTPMGSLAQEFLKWDILFISGTTLCAGLLFLRGIRPKLLTSCWFVLGSLCFGMGAALSGIWMWREKGLEGNRQVARQSKKD